MNIFSKENKAVADAVKRVLENSTMKVGEAAKVKPVESNLVNSVVSSGFNTNFHKSRTLKEENGEDKRTLHNASTDDPQANESKQVQKAKLSHTPKFPKPSTPSQTKTISSKNSPEGGNMREGWLEGMLNNYAIKMKAPTHSKESNEPPFSGPYKKSTDNKDEFGNVIKTKNVAKHLAKMGLKKVLSKREKKDK